MVRERSEGGTKGLKAGQFGGGGVLVATALGSLECFLGGAME